MPSRSPQSSPRSRSLGWIGLLGALLAAASGAAEWPISGGLAGKHAQPAAVRLQGAATEPVLVVWENDRSGLLARRLSEAGEPTGFVVPWVQNSAPLPVPGEGEVLENRSPTALAAGKDRVLLAWIEQRVHRRVAPFYQNDVLLDRDLVVRMFDAAGRAIGPARRIVSPSGIRTLEASPFLATLDPGSPGAGPSRHVVVFESVPGDGDADGDKEANAGVFAVRLDADGAPLGPWVKLNSRGGSTARRPVVAPAADGGFLAAWESWGDGDGTGIFSRRHDRNGVAVGPARRVNDTTDEAQAQAFVAPLAGGFAVTWTSVFENGTRSRIMARRLDGAGRVAGPEVIVSGQAGPFEGQSTLMLVPAGTPVAGPGPGDGGEGPGDAAGNPSPTLRAAWLRWNASYPVAVAWVALDADLRPQGAEVTVSEYRPGASGRLNFLVRPGAGRTWLGVWHGQMGRNQGFGIKASSLSAPASVP